MGRGPGERHQEPPGECRGIGGQPGSQALKTLDLKTVASIRSRDKVRL